MPCNCDHMEPTKHEQESKKVLGFLKELDKYTGEIPFYGMPEQIHEQTALLCKECQTRDVTKHSLELQLWWRDHQEADRQKLLKEQKTAKQIKDKEAVLNKLTTYERQLLGI